MMQHWTTIAIVILITAAPVVSAAPERGIRVGPAKAPLSHPDYGGTPDITITEEMGLSSQEIDRLLEKLGSADRSTREQAVAELERNAPGSEAALRKGLWDRHGARNTEMKEAMRTAGRRAAAAGDHGDIVHELVAMSPDHEERGDGTTGALRIMALLRALNSLDTLAAYKTLIEFSPRHAGVFRHEIGRMLVAHGLDALPALVYSRGSDNREIHMFAVKWIRDMGNPLLSEQVKIKNPRRLAQLLEAYASVNDLDVIDVTLSLTNHDSVFVRAAARSCLESFGTNAKWPARRLYENTFSREPKASKEVDEILAELYRYFDAQRLLPMTERFEAGLAARQEGRLEEMERLFREVLKHEPMFPKRGEMAAGFLDRAAELESSGDFDGAVERLRLARRVSEPGSEAARRAKARIRWLEAEKLRKKGIADVELYKSVLEVDPDHAGARKWLKRLTRSDGDTEVIVKKSLIVAFLIFLGVNLVLLRLRS